MIGKYLNGYANNPRGPARLVGVVRNPRPNDQAAYDYTLNENGTLVSYGTDPADYKQDVLTGKTVDFVHRRAPDPAALFPLAQLHGAPLRRPGPQPEPAEQLLHAREGGATPRRTRSTPSRCRGPPTSTRWTSPTSRPRSETSRASTGGSDRGHPAYVPLSAGITALRGRGGKGDRRSVDCGRRAGQHAGHLHLRQRLLPRRAPVASKQGAHLRGVDPGAPSDPRTRASHRG